MTQNGKVPFVDLVTLHQELESELLDVCQRALRTAGFIGGPEVDGFEEEFAQFCGTKYCVGVNSGTDALRFALIAAGVQPGEIVVTVPNTFIATTEAISQAGARPEFVDIDGRMFNMDVHKLRYYLETQCAIDPRTGRYIHKRLGKPVTAVVPVHLYGQMAAMDEVIEIAEQYSLLVIEDACQAHGAEYFSKKQNRWLKAGSVGNAAAFSFYPGKNLGACGEGGAVTTNDPEIARKVAMLRDHGQSRKYYHDLEGYNGRLDAIQAGMLRVKLRYVPKWNDQRRQSAARYQELFESMSDKILVPCEPCWSKSVYHLYVIRAQQRDELRTYLDRSGVATGIHYPIPLHLQKAYRALGYQPGDFPEVERAAAEIISLPMYPHLGFDQQRCVAQSVANFISPKCSQEHNLEVSQGPRARMSAAD